MSSAPEHWTGTTTKGVPDDMLPLQRTVAAAADVAHMIST
jgi:hypothetical protein